MLALTTGHYGLVCFSPGDFFTFVARFVSFYCDPGDLLLRFLTALYSKLLVILSATSLVLIFQFAPNNMLSFSYLLSFASLLALVSAHAQIIAAVGEAGSPTSVGFQGKKSMRSRSMAGSTLLMTRQSIRPWPETAQPSALANKTQLSSGMPRSAPTS